MGFGLLFLGYFFHFSYAAGGIDMLPDIFGCLLMFAALNRLTKFCPNNRGFYYARLWDIVYAAFAIAEFGLQIAKTSEMAVNETFVSVFGILYSLVIGVYHVFLLLGIVKLAREVGLPKLAGSAIRRLTLTAVYYAATFLAKTPFFQWIASGSQSPDNVLNFIYLTINLMGICWLLLNMVLLFSCYRQICLEGDEDMPEREDLYDKLLRYFKRNKKN